MKTSGILLQADNSNKEVAPQKLRPGILLKSLLIIFMLSWIMLLPSCMVAYRTPQYDGQGTNIERNDRGMNHHRRMRHQHGERYNRDDRQNRDVRHD